MREAGDHASDLSLPTLTGSCAHHAETVGAFGLVTRRLTNAYHPADLSRNQPSGTFTNHYHRTEDITHSGLDYVLCWVITD